MILILNKVPVIFLAQLYLFRIIKELQFGVCNHGESQASPPPQRKEYFCNKGKSKVVRLEFTKSLLKKLGVSSIELFTLVDL